MEEAGQATGYILFRTKMKEDVAAKGLIFKKVFKAFDKEIYSEQKGHWPLIFKEGKKWKIGSEPSAQLDFLIETWVA